ncbi:MAG: hypothetical protein ABII76_22770 [Pseudomonadota bacterium]
MRQRDQHPDAARLSLPRRRHAAVRQNFHLTTLPKFPEPPLIKTSWALDRWRKVHFSKRPKFGNEINSEPFVTAQLTVVFESENFCVRNFNMLAALQTIEWE